jgi:hypothetical protein
MSNFIPNSTLELDLGKVKVTGTAMDSKDKKRIRQTLSKKHICYVLITCSEPSEDGNMEVEMVYEGDAALASYILHGAQIQMDTDEEEIKEVCTNSKILSMNG